MTKPTCYIMSGVPGCGKSTWARKFTAEHDNVVNVSRDEIRFSLLADSDDYFACEDETVVIFYSEINEALAAGHDVIADATHISERALRETMRRIDIDCDKVLVSFDTPLDTCITRNAHRDGRARVPERVIRNMWLSKNRLGRAIRNNKISIRVLHAGKDC